jgi:hypothetical protein
MVFSKFLDNPETLDRTLNFGKTPPPTSPNIALAILGEAQEGAKSLDWTHQWIIPNRHRLAPAGCCLMVFDFEKAISP